MSRHAQSIWMSTSQISRNGAAACWKAIQSIRTKSPARLRSSLPPGLLLALLVVALTISQPGVTPPASAQGTPGSTKTILFSQSHFGAEEGGVGTITITRTGEISDALENVTLTLEATGTGLGHAIKGTDFPARNLIVAFAPHKNKASTTIRIPTDHDVEGLETFKLKVKTASLPNAFDHGVVSEATFHITDVVTVPDDWALLPSGLEPGDKFRLLFLTRKHTWGTGNADYYNQEVKNTILLSGTHTELRKYRNSFRAVVSGTDRDAVVNTGTHFTRHSILPGARGYPIYWPDQRLAAVDYQEFYEGDAWADTRANTRDGVNREIDWTTWTGTYNLHLLAAQGKTSDADDLLGRASNRPIGTADGPGVTVHTWSDNGQTNIKSGGLRPNQARRLLALSQVFQVAPRATVGFDKDFYQGEEGTNLEVTLRTSKSLAADETVTVTAVATGNGEGHATISGAGRDVPATSWTISRTGAGTLWKANLPLTEDNTIEGLETLELRIDPDQLPQGVKLTPGAETARANIIDVHTVPANWPLKPAGVNAGGKFRLAFITGSEYSAQATDIAHYNSKVRTEAKGQSAHAAVKAHEKSFRVIASTGQMDAIDNTGTRFVRNGTAAEKGHPIYWVAAGGGAKMADDYQHLYDGAWNDNDATLPSGAEATPTSSWFAWFGTNTAGFLAPSYKHLAGTKRYQSNQADATTRPYYLGSPKVRLSHGDTQFLAEHGDGSQLFKGSLTSNIRFNDFNYRLLALSQVFKVAGGAPPPQVNATVQLAREVYQVEEGEDLTLGVTLSTGLAQDATFSITPSATGAGSGHAATPADFAAGPWSVTVTAGSNAGSVTIPMPHDAAIEGPETFKITLDTASLPAGVTAGGTTTANVAIIDVHEVPNNWALKPAGLNPGDKFRLLFVTSQRNATSRLIADYNKHVENNINEEGGVGDGTHSALEDTYGLSFRAVGSAPGDSSNPAVNARQNTATRHTPGGTGAAQLGRPIYWVDGRQVADDYEDFYDGAWFATHGMTRNASRHSRDRIDWEAWTGTFHAGMSHGNAQNAGTITGNGLGATSVTTWKRRTSGNTLSIESGAAPNNQQRRLLALSQVFQVELPKITPAISVTAGGGVTEGGNAVFTLKASAAPNASLTVSLTVADAPHADFINSSVEGAQTVTIGRGRATATYTIATVADDVDEPNGPVKVTVAPAAGYTVDSSNMAAVTVSDDDSTTSEIAGATTAITEGDDKTFTVSIGRALRDGEILAIPLSFTGTATKGSDYTMECGTAAGVTCDFTGGSEKVTFTGSAGGSATSVTLTLKTKDEGNTEAGGETVNINPGTPVATSMDGGAAATTDSFGEFTINDVPPAPTEVPLTDDPVWVAADWPLIPAGLTAGDQFRLLFISTSTRDATSPVIGDYNRFVHTDIDSGHESIAVHKGLYRAVASTAGADARDNTRTTGSGVPIYWLNGPKVADDYADFYDGSWDNRAKSDARDNAGNAFSGSIGLIWTGSADDGTKRDGRALGDSKVGTADLDHASSKNPLDARHTESWNTPYRFYAMSPVYQVGGSVAQVPHDWALKPSAVGAGEQFRLLFVTSGKRDKSATDIAVYNKFVQGFAEEGHADIRLYGNGFRALASTGATDAHDNTGTTGTGMPIYWLNGPKVADNYADLYDETWDNRAATDVRDESGNAFSGAIGLIYTGSEHDGAKSADHLGSSGPVTVADLAHADSKPPLNANFKIDGNQRFYAMSPVFQVETVTPELTITGSGSVTEGSSATYTVTANNAPIADLTVHYTVTDAPNADFINSANQGGKTAVITAGQATTTITLATAADSADEPGGTIKVTLNPAAGYTIGSPNAAITTVSDDDPTTSAITGATAAVVEGGVKTFTVSIGRALRAGEKLVVPLNFGGTATKGTDYTVGCPNALPTGVTCDFGGGSEAITFTGSAGGSSTSVTITLTTQTDSNAEGGETVNVNPRGSPTATALDGGASATTDSFGAFTINDPVRPTINIAGGGAPVTEGSLASFTLTISPSPNTDLTVRYTVADAPHADFVNAGNQGSQSITIPSGIATATFSVATAADSVDEFNGPVQVTLTADSAYVVGSSNMDAVTVTDDDPTTSAITGTTDAVTEGRFKAFNVSIGRALRAGEKLVVPLAFTGTATKGADYSVSGFAATGVSHNLSAGVERVVFTGSAEGSATSATLRIKTKTDDSTEAGGETVNVNPRGNPTPTNLSGGASTTTDNFGQFTINDPPIPTPDNPAVTIISDSLKVTEGEGARFRLIASPAPAANITVKVNVVDEGDYAAAGQTGTRQVTITTSGVATFTVKTVDDSVDENYYYITVALIDGAGFHLGDPRSALVQIQDNDDAVLLSLRLDTSTTNRANLEGSPPLFNSSRRVLIAELSETLSVSTPYQVCFTDSAATRGADFDVYVSGSKLAANQNCAKSSIPAGSKADKRISFAVIDDATEEDPATETVIAELQERSDQALPAGVSLTDNPTATFTIVDDDTGSVKVRSILLGANPDEVREGGDYTELTLVSSDKDHKNHTLVLNLNFGGTATFGKDYWVEYDINRRGFDLQPTTNSAHQITWHRLRKHGSFPVEQEVYRIRIHPISDDDDDEGSETVTVSIGGRTYIKTTGGVNWKAGLTAASGAATVTIRDKPPVLSFAQETVTFGEDASNRVLFINASKAPEKKIDFYWHISGTATQEGAGRDIVQDYFPSCDCGFGSLFPWQTSQKILIRIIDDDIVESDETVVWTLIAFPSTKDSYIIGDPSTLTITIKDNDGGTTTRPPPPATPVASFVSGSSSAAESAGTRNVPVNLNPAPQSAITLSYTVGGTATSGSDYTALSGSVAVSSGATSVNIPVAITDDSAVESGETVTLTLSAGSGYTRGSPSTHTLTITDNDVAPPSTPVAQFASATSSAAESAGTRNVTVNLNPAPQSAITLSYTVGGTATSGSDYTALSGSVAVSSGATSVNIPVAITDDSAVESGETVILTLATGTGYTVGSGNTHTLTITDNDVAPPATPAASFAASSSNAAESAGTRNVTVNLSPAPSTAITLSYTVGGTATSGSDYTALSGSVAVSSGAISVNIPVAITDDSADENSETIILTLSTGTGYTLGNLKTHTLTIADNDADGVRISKNALTLTEGGSGGTYTVRLESDPGGSATVTPASSDTDIVTVSGALSFNSGNWQNPQTVTVTPVDDADTRGETATITHAVSGYGSITTAGSVSVTVRDDDQPEVTVSGPASVNEGATASFTINVAPAPSAAITVRLNAAQTGDFAQSSDLGNKLVTFASGETSKTITVRTVDDDRSEVNGAVRITASLGSGYILGSASSHTVEVVDDDGGGTPVLRLVGPSSPAFEGGDAIAFTIHADPAATSSISVTVNVAEQPSGQYIQSANLGQRTVTLGANRARQSFTVPIHDDSVEETSAGTVTATLVAGAGYLIKSGGGTASASVNDNDGLRISVGDTSGHEGCYIHVPVTLTAPSPWNLSVSTRTSPRYGTDNQARMGTDFQEGGHALDFAAGEQVKYILVWAYVDKVAESDELFDVDIHVPHSGVTVVDDSAVITIKDGPPSGGYGNCGAP